MSAVASEIVQAAGQLHDDIVKALFGVPEHVLDDSAALDPRNDVLDDPRMLEMSRLDALSSSESLPPRGFFLGWWTVTPGNSCP